MKIPLLYEDHELEASLGYIMKLSQEDERGRGRETEIWDRMVTFCKVAR